MSENKFWLLFWTILATTLITLIGSGIYSGYLDNKRDQHYVDKGLQPYKTTICKQYLYDVEWHEAGWIHPNTETILKDK
jgi:hypothetical protein